MDDERIRIHSEAYKLCIAELNTEYPDYHAAQVYATLSIEEALRDLADRMSVALRRLC